MLKILSDWIEGHSPIYNQKGLDSFLKSPVIKIFEAYTNVIYQEQEPDSNKLIQDLGISRDSAQFINELEIVYKNWEDQNLDYSSLQKRLYSLYRRWQNRFNSNNSDSELPNP